MSSAVGRWAGFRRSDRSASLIGAQPTSRSWRSSPLRGRRAHRVDGRRSGWSSSSRPRTSRGSRRSLRAPGSAVDVVASPPVSREGEVGRGLRAADRSELGELVDLGLEGDRDRLASPMIQTWLKTARVGSSSKPGWVSLRKLCRAGGTVAAIVGEQQRSRAAAGAGQRRGGRGVERPVDVGDREPVAGVVDVPAEVAARELGELDRVLDRILGADRGSRSPSFLSALSEIADVGPSTKTGVSGWRLITFIVPFGNVVCRRRTGSDRRSGPPMPPPASRGSSRSS